MTTNDIEYRGKNQSSVRACQALALGLDRLCDLVPVLVDDNNMSVEITIHAFCDHFRTSNDEFTSKL